MKKMKNMLRKGGVADVVTLIIIVGLVIGLIAIFVVPMINRSSSSGANTKSTAEGVFSTVDNMATDSSSIGGYSGDISGDISGDVSGEIFE